MEWAVCAKVLNLFKYYHYMEYDYFFSGLEESLHLIKKLNISVTLFVVQQSILL